MKYSVSVIIPVHSTSFTIEACLSSVLSQKIPKMASAMEVMVVMDRCSPSTEKPVKSFESAYHNFSSIISSYPGASAARNAGIAATKGDILVFLDDDTVLPDNQWLKRLCTILQDNPSATAVGGGYLTESGSTLLLNCYNAIVNYHMDSRRLKDNRTTSLIGGNSAYRRSAFNNNSNFNESIIYGSEEDELNAKLLAEGKQFYYYNDLSIFHIHDKQDNFLTFMIKQTRLGAGKAYINGIMAHGKIHPHKSNKRFWFIRIAIDMKTSTVSRISAGAVLFCFACCYWAGYLSGRLKYMMKYRAHA